MDEPRKFPPNIMLTQMRQGVSRSGAPYLEGRIGLAKVLVLKSSKVDDEGNTIWNLCLQEIPREDTARPAASKPSIFSTAKPDHSESRSGLWLGGYSPAGDFERGISGLPCKPETAKKKMG